MDASLGDCKMPENEITRKWLLKSFLGVKLNLDAVYICVKTDQKVKKRCLYIDEVI